MKKYEDKKQFNIFAPEGQRLKAHYLFINGIMIYYFEDWCLNAT